MSFLGDSQGYEWIYIIIFERAHTRAPMAHGERIERRNYAVYTSHSLVGAENLPPDNIHKSY